MQIFMMLKGSELHSLRLVLLQIKLSQAFIVVTVLVTFKNEEDLIKNEGAKLVTSLIINFSIAQEQLTQ